MARPFRFGVSASPADRAGWLALARRTEDLGYATLLTPDHLGMASSLAPLVAAADATQTLRVGTLVLNAEFHHPLRLAQELATVDMLTGGRLEAGLGSGWARPEFEQLGLDYRPARERAARLLGTLEVIEQAWRRDASDAAAGGPAPVQAPRPPLLIGGHGDAILEVAAAHADIVGFTGVTWRGTSLQPTGISVDSIEERVGFVRSAAGERFADLELSCLVQLAAREEGAAEAAAARFGVPRAVLDASPFVLVGGAEQVAEKLLALRERLGTSYFVVFEAALAEFAPVVAQLSGQ